MDVSPRWTDDTASREGGDARRATLQVASLDAGDRTRVEEILRATSVFRDGEVEVALELFDETYGGAGSGVSGPGSERPRDVPSGTTRPETPDPRPDYEFVGVFTPGRTLVGYACYGPTPATDRTYDLYWIVIDPAAQGSGAGTLLLGEVERRLREARGRLLVVETSSREEYDATRGFYLARGYQEVARVGHFYAPGDDRVIYTKRLSREQFSALGRVPAEGGRVLSATAAGEPRRPEVAAESREPRAESLS